jgi:Flp pilus assembly protein TadD
MEADPHAPVLRSSLAWAYFLAGDAEAALAQTEVALGQFPDHPLVLVFAARLLAAAGNPGDGLTNRAIQIARRLVEARPDIDSAHTALAYACAREGNSAEARAILDRQVSLSRERFVMRSIHAPVLVALGDLDGAVEELALAEKLRCPWFFELLHDPRLLPLHSHPGFQRLRAIAKKMESALPAA